MVIAKAMVKGLWQYNYYQQQQQQQWEYLRMRLRGWHYNDTSGGADHRQGGGQGVVVGHDDISVAPVLAIIYGHL